VTIFLSCTICFAMSYRIMTKHRDTFNWYMHEYLRIILEIFPSLKLLPNHHSALHLGEFFLHYRPIHNWWMFPFKQIIGSLQKVNNNYKEGTK